MKEKGYIVIFVLFLLYFFLPTTNPSTDSWYYAACVKYNHDLFLPHHLLYNFSCYWLYSLVAILHPSLDALSFMQGLNALLAAITLFVLSKILKRTTDPDKVAGLILLAGASFGFFRFATENEVYIFPILFSTIGTLFFLEFILKERKTVLLPAIFLAIACLFHQLHFFWWLAGLVTLMIYKRNYKTIFLYLIPALVVPFTYLAIIRFAFHKELTLFSFMHYTFFEYYNGVSTSFSLDYLKFGVINMIRSFVQIHGIIPVLIKFSRLFFIPVIATMLLLFIALRQRPLVKRNEDGKFNQFSIFILIAVILHLLFAVYSYGNVEFMVMIPLLAVIFLSLKLKLHTKAVYYLGIALLSWNLFLSVLPNKLLNLQTDEFILNKYEDNPTGVYILNESQRIENSLFYQNRVGMPGILKTPFSFQERSQDLAELQELISHAFENGQLLYTDCLNEGIIDRRVMLSQEINKEFFDHYTLTKADSTTILKHTYYLYSISEK
ncbi:hypothetical protein ACFLRI_03310 [Bacteroidota bacterium]